MKQSTIDFNKEILVGELGALVSAPSVAFIASKFTSTASIISNYAVGGAVAGASFFWLLMRIYDKNWHKDLSLKSLGKDISYFTPAAFLLTALVYYPTLFLLSKHLLTQNYRVFSSVVLSQTTAFALFLFSTNLYRYILLKLFGKSL